MMQIAKAGVTVSVFVLAISLLSCETTVRDLSSLKLNSTISVPDALKVDKKVFPRTQVKRPSSEVSAEYQLRGAVISLIGKQTPNKKMKTKYKEITIHSDDINPNYKVYGIKLGMEYDSSSSILSNKTDTFHKKKYDSSQYEASLGGNVDSISVYVVNNQLIHIAGRNGRVTNIGIADPKWFCIKADIPKVCE